MIGLGADIVALKKDYKLQILPKDILVKYKSKLGDETYKNRTRSSSYLTVGGDSLTTDIITSLPAETNKISSSPDTNRRNRRLSISIGGIEQQTAIIDQINNEIISPRANNDISKVLRREYLLFIQKLGSSGQAPIHVAAIKGNSDCFTYLIDKLHCNINLVDSFGRTPLLYACKYNQLNILEILVEKTNLNANFCSKSNNRSALHYISCHPIQSNENLKKYVYIIKKLIDKGLYVNEITLKQDYLASHYAAIYGNSRMISLLKFFNSSITKPCLNGMTPIQMAARENKFENVSTLLIHGCLKDELTEGVNDKSYSNEICKIYNSFQPQNNNNKTPDYYDEIQNKEIPILSEMFLGKEHSIHEFLKSKPKLTEIIKFIRKEGLNCLQFPNENGRISIHLISEIGYFDVIPNLIEKYLVPINRLDHDGNSCLHIAAQHGQIKTLEVLLDFNANLNILNSFGNTILHSLASYQDQFPSSLKDFMNNKIFSSSNQDNQENMILFDCDTLNSSGFSALHMAAMSGNNLLISCLLENKATIDLNSVEGHTALFYAMINNKKSAVRLLRSRGASIDWITPEFEKTVSPIIMDVIKIVSSAAASKRTISPSHSSGKDKDIILDINGSPVDDPVQYFHSLTVTGNKQEIRKLLKKNPKLLFSKDHEGSSVLHIAAFLQNQELMTFFIEKKLDPNIVNSKGYAPLIIAAKSGNLPVSFFFPFKIRIQKIFYQDIFN